MTTGPRTSAQGFELQWAVNHLAPFALTTRLLPLVQKASGGRVIATSSFAHHVGRVPPEKGAPTGVFLATAAEAGSGPGRYWSSCRPRKGSGRITNTSATLLWDLTEAALAGKG